MMREREVHSIDIIQNWSGFHQLKSDWQRLLEQCDANTLFLTWEWVDCWYHSQEKEVKPLIVVIKEEGVVVAIAPFYHCQYRLFRGVTYQALLCLGDRKSGAEYSNFIVHRSQSQLLKKRLWEALLAPGISELWDFIWLHNIAAWTESGDSLIASLSEVKQLKVQQREQTFACCSLVEKEVPILLQVGKSLRKNISQTKRRLDRLGAWRVDCCSDAADLESLLEQFFSLHQKRWSEKGELGSFQRSGELQDFYRNFAPLALKKEWLKLCYLESEGTIQAMQLGYIYNGHFLALQEGYNPDFLAGTGQVLRHEIMQQCIDEQLLGYDFLGVYTDHKRRWLAERKEGAQLFIYQNKVKNLPFYFHKIWPTGAYLTVDQ